MYCNHDFSDKENERQKITRKVKEGEEERMDMSLTMKAIVVSTLITRVHTYNLYSFEKYYMLIYNSYAY